METIAQREASKSSSHFLFIYFFFFLVGYFSLRIRYSIRWRNKRKKTIRFTMSVWQSCMLMKALGRDANAISLSILGAIFIYFPPISIEIMHKISDTLSFSHATAQTGSSKGAISLFKDGLSKKLSWRTTSISSWDSVESFSVVKFTFLLFA